MEENQSKIGKFSLNFGLITGFIGIVFALILFSMDLHYESGFAIQGVQIAILAAGIILGISQFKKANVGFLSLGQALKLGAGIALVAGILGLLYFFVFSNFIEPDFMDKMYEIGKQQAMEDSPKLTSEQIDQGIEMQKKFAWVTYPVILIFNIIIGLIVGLIGGLIMKKAKPAY